MTESAPFPSIPCPYCRQPCTCWTDHVGATGQLMQAGPYVCRACGATEGGWDDDYGGAVFDRATGWLMPTMPSSEEGTT